MNFDVAVVGAGPAGSTAALHLARNGIGVILIEKAALPRYKTCGGGVLRRAFDLMPHDGASAVERECFSAELNFARHQLHFVTRRETPVVYMTMRSSLDHALALAAKAAGAQIHDSSPVTAVRALPGSIELVTSKCCYRVRFVVASDGANSFIARQAGWRAISNSIPALEYEVRVSAEMFGRFSHAARFDFGLVPSGYAWVFPKRDHLSVGVLTTRHPSSNLHALANEYLNVLGLHEQIGIERHGYLIPVKPRPGPMANNRVLLTGDAAGLADPVTAEGITHALISGRMAAESILEAQLKPGLVERRYQARLDETLIRELRSARVLALLWYRQPCFAAWVFEKHGQTLCEKVSDIMIGKQSYRTLLADALSLRNIRRLFRSCML